MLKSDKPEIHISNHHSKFRPPVTNSTITELVCVINKREWINLKKIDINYLDDKNLKKLNKQFLNHNYNTDILTFDYSKKGLPNEAELLLSLDRIKKNAEFYNTSYKQEFKRVLIHGMLHLAGYNDSTLKEQELIRNKENFYLSKFT